MATKGLFMRAAEVAKKINETRGRKTKKITEADIHDLIFVKKAVPERHLIRRAKNSEGQRVLLIKATATNIRSIEATWKEQQKFKRRLKSTDLSRKLKNLGVEASSDDLVIWVKKNLIHGEKYGRHWFFRPKSVPAIADKIEILRSNVAKYARYKGRGITTAQIGILGVSEQEKKEIKALAIGNPANLKIIKGCTYSKRKVLDPDFFKGKISALDTLIQIRKTYKLAAETFSLKVVIPAWLLRDGKDKIDEGFLKYYLRAASRLI